MINQLEIVGFLKTNGTQCRFASILSDTAPKLKQGCPYTGVRKVSNKIGLLNANYNTSVRRRLAETNGVTLAEQDYENGEVWYEHLQTVDGKNLPVVVNKTKQDGKFYLQYFPLKSSHKYVDANGIELSETQLEPYFYKQSARPEYKPCVISIDLANVRQLKASGVVIETPDFEEASAILAD